LGRTKISNYLIPYIIHLHPNIDALFMEEMEAVGQSDGIFRNKAIQADYAI
jgi:hypothetical protein